MKTETKTEVSPVKDDILQTRKELIKRFRRFWAGQSAIAFEEFQKALVSFYQKARVHINEDRFENLVQSMDNELVVGEHQGQVKKEDVKKWLDYYNQINKALQGHGLLNESDLGVSNKLGDLFAG